jgi:hypothetical protein
VGLVAAARDVAPKRLSENIAAKACPKKTRQEMRRGCEFALAAWIF